MRARTAVISANELYDDQMAARAQTIVRGDNTAATFYLYGTHAIGHDDISLRSRVHRAVGPAGWLRLSHHQVVTQLSSSALTWVF